MLFDFLLVCCIISFIIVALNASDERRTGDFPALELGMAALTVSTIALTCAAYDIRTEVEARQMLYRNLPLLGTALLVYLAIGGAYTLVVWRYRLLPKIKARWQALQEKGATIENVRNGAYQYEFYVPEGENIVLPVLSSHATHLIWLVHFWVLDLARYALGNVLGKGLKFVCITIPHTLGTIVYNAIKAELERLARSVMR